ncbi:uncharacterized protein BHQ10_002052 [Talaromyces amestolkiae]|uniref:Oxidoreductase AflY n=1 Tax=Talaromyces amestolkiae TaxID=1196081 RepID=A0A364KR67_TALAM|nr:uncharacterized protein BHQ10_002052 [Talaromyces amestolkiae]RAO66040.1 hypothetical protein BHQ10_002052 [Talaromyces amestolkiae]
MATTTTTTQQIRLSGENLGLGRISKNPAGSIETANSLLQKNHDIYHIFWRDVGGHNHIAHSVLSILALGGSPSDLQRAYDDGAEIQRPIPPVNLDIVKGLADPVFFRKHIGDIDQYTNFLVFFEQEIAVKGREQVLQEYVFGRAPNAETIFAQLYEGAYHPIIHLGFGVEFELPTIIAEGLAQAAVHDSAGLEAFFNETEELAAAAVASGLDRKPLNTLYDEVRVNDKIRTAARLQDGPVRVRDGVLGRAGKEIAALASQYRIKPTELERATAEMINLSAYSAGAAQRPGKKRKIDFFHMHNVNCSIFFTAFNNQSWISLEDKVRLVERKARLDLVWYAASAAAELHLEAIVNYKPTFSAGLDWKGLYDAVNKTHDDGHVAKFVRAIKNGEEVSKPFEEGEGSDHLPVKGESWFKLAQMAYDTTYNQEVDDKWIWGVGYDPLWAKIPALEE